MRSAYIAAILVILMYKTCFSDVKVNWDNVRGGNPKKQIEIYYNKKKGEKNKTNSSEKLTTSCHVKLIGNTKDKYAILKKLSNDNIYVFKNKKPKKISFGLYEFRIEGACSGFSAQVKCSISATLYCRDRISVR